MYVEGLERVLDSERVHDGREHAHVVARDAIHAGARETFAAENVAAADDDRDLDAGLAGCRDFGGYALNDLRLDAVFQFTHQRFTAELQQYAMVLNRTVIHTVPLRQNRPLILAQSLVDHTKINGLCDMASCRPEPAP